MLNFENGTTLAIQEKFENVKYFLYQNRKKLIIISIILSSIVIAVCLLWGFDVFGKYSKDTKFNTEEELKEAYPNGADKVMFVGNTPYVWGENPAAWQPESQPLTLNSTLLDEEDYATLQAQITVNANNIAELQKKISDLESDITSADNSLKESITKQINTLKQDLYAKYEEQKTLIQQTTENLTQVKNEIQTQITQINNKLATDTDLTKDTIDGLKKEQTDLRSDLISITQELSSTTTYFQNLVSDFSTELASLQDSLGKTKTELSTAVQLGDTQQQQKLEKAIADINKQISNISVNLTDSSSDLKVLIETLTNDLTNLQSDLGQLTQEQKAALDNTRIDLEAKINAITNNLSTAIDGITPRIDTSTKNWMIGETDTGVKAAAQNIKLRINGAYIQWAYDGTEDWSDLVALDSIKGDKGDKGEKGDKGDVGPAGRDG